MNTTENGAPTEALVWTKKREWGCVSLTHRAVVTEAGVQLRFAALKPGGQSRWIVQAWRNGEHAMYRDGRTLADVKDQAADWLAAHRKQGTL